MIARVAGLSVSLALAGIVPAQGAAGTGPVSVIASRGHGDGVAAALRAAALPVVRRSGARMQVNAPAARIAAIRRLPGVAAAYPAPGGVPATDPEEDPGAKVTPVAGPVMSEGLERIGADALQSLARDGRGVTIAVLDLGFGPISRIVGLQRRKELPPSSRLETASFDPAWGFAGRNAYGNPTNHGELVAQTVYDFAPAARYLFVNYHTEQDFQAAVDWLIARRPDVVVHSNSFLEGPFDGTGAAAQAVDRAAAAGIAWVNSAGNYAERHWEGTWADGDGDEVLDWPRAPGWSFAVAPGKPITFALSWDQPEGAEVTDLDLVLEKLTPGGWAAVAASRDSQLAGAPPAERLTGIPSGDGGEFRVRVALAGGPPPPGTLTMFSREIPMDAIGDPGPGSIPTPGDADGAIAVGAVGWKSNAIKAYSSRGPTDDGRLKPDLTAPTNTRVQTPTGPRSVGGTSNAAPNAAGAIALLIAARRRAGAPLDLTALGDLLATQALDLGLPGPDDVFGAGRVRVDVDPPEIRMTARPRRSEARLPVRVGAEIGDASRVVGWSVAVDGRTVARRWGEVGRSVALGSRWLPDGLHEVVVTARDWPGNVSTRRMDVFVDSRPPRLASLRLTRPSAARTGARAAASRAARLALVARDASPARLVITLRAPDGREIRRVVRFRGTVRRDLALGSLPAGRYEATIAASDAAGHARTLTRVLRLRAR